MFEGFAEQWTPLLPSEDVTGTLRSVMVAGTPLVTWRTPDGQPVVFLDRCPHRSVALSLGSTTPDGSTTADGSTTGEGSTAGEQSITVDE